jgi:hypothetical protein
MRWRAYWQWFLALSPIRRRFVSENKTNRTAMMLQKSHGKRMKRIFCHFLKHGSLSTHSISSKVSFLSFRFISLFLFAFPQILAPRGQYIRTWIRVTYNVTRWIIWNPVWIPQSRLIRHEWLLCRPNANFQILLSNFYWLFCADIEWKSGRYKQDWEGYIEETLLSLGLGCHSNPRLRWANDLLFCHLIFEIESERLSFILAKEEKKRLQVCREYPFTLIEQKLISSSLPLDP